MKEGRNWIQGGAVCPDVLLRSGGCECGRMERQAWKLGMIRDGGGVRGGIYMTRFEIVVSLGLSLRKMLGAGLVAKEIGRRTSRPRLRLDGVTWNSTGLVKGRGWRVMIWVMVLSHYRRSRTRFRTPLHS